MLKAYAEEAIAAAVEATIAAELGFPEALPPAGFGLSALEGRRIAMEVIRRLHQQCEEAWRGSNDGMTSVGHGSI